MALLGLIALLGRLLTGGGRAGFALAGLRAHWQGEPDELAVRRRGDSPVLRELLNDPKPSPRLLPGRRGAHDRLALTVIAHLDADLASRAVDREHEVAMGMPHAVGGKLRGHQLRGFHGLARLIAQDIGDEVACASHRLCPAVKATRLPHDSTENTPERPVAWSTRRMIGDGLRSDTPLAFAAAPISTAIPALSMNRRPVRSKISGAAGCGGIDATRSFSDAAFELSSSPERTTTCAPVGSRRISIRSIGGSASSSAIGCPLSPYRRGGPRMRGRGQA